MHIVNFKIFPIALSMHFFAENAQFWMKMALKKFKLKMGDLRGHNEYKLVMRDGTGHSKFIFKIPYSFYFLSFDFFFTRKNICFTSPQN